MLGTDTRFPVHPESWQRQDLVFLSTGNSGSWGPRCPSNISCLKTRLWIINRADAARLESPSSSGAWTIPSAPALPLNHVHARIKRHNTREIKSPRGGGWGRQHEVAYYRLAYLRPGARHALVVPSSTRLTAHKTFLCTFKDKLSSIVGMGNVRPAKSLHLGLGWSNRIQISVNPDLFSHQH